MGNPFERFRDLPEDEWLNLLRMSLTERVVEGVEFPGFPDDELQSDIHGTPGEVGQREAFNFYRVCRRYYEPGGRLLDFGAGWGRITRPFMRDFPADGLYGYEPNLEFCMVARSLNPYACYLHGPFQPADALPRSYFDVAVGYSVFSHLPERLALAWLEELRDSLRPGGVCIMTTYGSSWLARLRRDAAAIARGESVHWYAQQCLEEAGSLDELERRHEAGDFIEFGGGPNYRTCAFVSEGFLHAIEGLEFVAFDPDDRQPQEVFVLRRA